MVGGNDSWTRRMLSDIRRWINRTPGLVVSFHLAQSLTGHGCFRDYLSKKGRATTPYCNWCPGITDDVEHTIFVCPQFEAHRVEAVTLLVGRPTFENTQDDLCAENVWTTYVYENTQDALELNPDARLRASFRPEGPAGFGCRRYPQREGGGWEAVSCGRVMAMREAGGRGRGRAGVEAVVQRRRRRWGTVNQ